MKLNQLARAILGVGFALSTSSVFAASLSFDYNYMATNLAGSFGGKAVSVAKLHLSDLAGGAGVRATFSVNPNGLSQFSTGVGAVYISSFELNFPGTSEAAGYDSDANVGLGNNWANVSGVPLAGGVEWQEGGATNGWAEFGQENNWGNGTGFTGIMTQTSGESVIDFFNAPGEKNISVANILSNPVLNANASLPAAYSWIKIRSNRSTNSNNRGIVSTGWWGNTPVSTRGAASLDVIATEYTYTPDVSEVPVPAALPLMASALGLFGISRKRRKTV